MPRFVRPFWIDGKVGGRDAFATGPRSLKPGEDSEIRVTFKQRDHGMVTDALTVAGYIDERTGAIRLNVFGPDGTRIFQHETQS